MILSITGLTAGFIVVVSLLFFLLLKTQISVFAKALALLVVSVFFVVQYKSLHQFLGWPSSARLPAEFVLIATNVREPNKQTGDPGVMYWWVRESSDLTQPPRVYELPYKAELQHKTEEVLKQQKQGAQYVGKKTNEAPSSGSGGVSFEKISKTNHFKKNSDMISN